MRNAVAYSLHSWQNTLVKGKMISLIEEKLTPTLLRQHFFFRLPFLIWNGRSLFLKKIQHNLYFGHVCTEIVYQMSV